MLYTIVSLDDIFETNSDVKRQQRLSSNPYDYVRAGYYLDNAALFGGVNYVNYHCDITSHITGNRFHHTD